MLPPITPEQRAALSRERQEVRDRMRAFEREVREAEAQYDRQQQPIRDILVGLKDRPTRSKRPKRSRTRRTRNPA